MEKDTVREFSSLSLFVESSSELLGIPFHYLRDYTLEYWLHKFGKQNCVLGFNCTEDVTVYVCSMSQISCVKRCLTARVYTKRNNHFVVVCVNL